MALPQAEPLPCPGYITTESGKVIILFLSDSNKCPARSSFVIRPYLTAKSGLPTSPKNTVSPE